MKPLFCFFGKHLWKMEYTGKPLTHGCNEEGMFIRRCFRCQKKEINFVDKYGIWFWGEIPWLT